MKVITYLPFYLLIVLFIIPSSASTQQVNVLSLQESNLITAPSDVRANPLNYDSVKVSWRDRSNDEEGFEIQRSGNGIDYLTLTTVTANTKTYTDNGVNPNAFYVYRVRSVKTGESSAYSVSNSIVTPAFPSLTRLTEGRSFSVADQYNTSPTGEEVACAFDDDANTKFLARNSTVWLRVSFNEAYKAEQYSVTSANDSPERDPQNWRLEGSDNGTSWTVLDTRVNEAFGTRFQKRFFTIQNAGSYRHYRLSITRNSGNVNLTQLADWLLYADVPIGTDQVIPNKPTNFRLENRGYHHVKLSWNDVANETGYRIERSEDGGATYTHTYEIPANNTESYPYSLKPETNYVFKIYAVNGANVSAPEYVSVTTGEKEFVERFDNLSLWIFDAPVTLKKVREIGNVAFYIPEQNTLTDIDELYYQFYAQNWEYVYLKYGYELSDSRLHVMLFPMEEGGGVASIANYRDSPHHINMVYIKANKNWFKNRSESGYIYDVMSHELCHIVEGVGGGYNGSMFFPVWGDSKWAEIFQYDIFAGLGVSRAQSWHQEYTQGANPKGGAEYPNASRTSYWYRDFLYPTYHKYGKTEVLTKLWKLQQQYYRMRNGSFRGSSANPGGRGNLGEFIHFWSGAAGTDVKPYAVKAFGWNEQFEAWLQQAKIDYPQITYSEVEIDNSYKNICQNGGVISSNYTFSNVNIFIDNSSVSYASVIKNSRREIFELTYQSSSMAKIDKYSVTVHNNVIPAAWILFGSNDEASWFVVDEQNSPVFENDKFTFSLNESPTYKYFKFDFVFGGSGQIRLNEVELWGTEHMSAAHDLKAKSINEETVYVDWSCLLDEVAYFELERSVNGTDFSKIADIDRYEISFTDESLLPGEYYYRVLVVNKNSEKEKLSSNIAYVNTTVSGVGEVRERQKNIYDVASDLQNYPDNRVYVFNLAGQKVFDNQYVRNDLIQYLQSTLSKGIYTLRIVLDKNNSLNVNGKLVVW